MRTDVYLLFNASLFLREGTVGIKVTIFSDISTQ